MAVMSDPISDFLIRLKNASSAGLIEFKVPYSAIKLEITKILIDEGYIADYSRIDFGIKSNLIIKIKYKNRQSVIANVKRVSKPGARKYIGVDKIPKVIGGMGVSILSTSKGLMTGVKAKKINMGGELLALIW